MMKETMRLTAQETYLGDGLYASFDGYAVKLRAPTLEGDQIVYLDREGWDLLVEFVAGIKPAITDL